jgi:hypothetical protein
VIVAIASTLEAAHVSCIVTLLESVHVVPPSRETERTTLDGATVFVPTFIRDDGLAKVGTKESTLLVQDITELVTKATGSLSVSVPAASTAISAALMTLL